VRDGSKSRATRATTDLVELGADLAWALHEALAFPLIQFLDTEGNVVSAMRYLDGRA
jgi:hypothetical protein